MEDWIRRILNPFMVVSMFIFSSFYSVDEIIIVNEAEDYTCELNNNLEHRLDSLSYKVYSLQCEIKNNYNISDQSVRLYMSEKLALALYNSHKYSQKPQFMFTSMLRPNNKKSKHCYGNAFDIRYDLTIIQWLESSEGLRWLEDNNLRYLVEFTSRKCRYYKAAKIAGIKNIYINEEASAKHIHVEIKSTI